MIRTIPYELYRDKVLGGWIGKSLGGTIGRFEGTRRITHFRIEDLAPEKVLANDDLDVQLVWLEVLLEKGIHFRSQDLMSTWLRDYDFNYGEYGYARRNALRGIAAPCSGEYGNAYYVTGMGCPIRSEVWGMICPGNPPLAAEYAAKDGILDHAGESVWAEQFLAALEAEAFFESDLNRLLDIGMEYLPTGSHVRGCIHDARSLHAEGHPWERTWETLRNHHSHPDCSYAPFNLGLVVMALLYGQGDLEKTLTITVNSGWDVDCTCATSGAILGIIAGREGLPPRWVDYVGDTVATIARLQVPMPTLSAVTEITCRAGVTVARELNHAVEIGGIPLALEAVPAVRHRQDVEFSVDYLGPPAVGWGESKELEIALHNHTPDDLWGRLSLALPDGWRAETNGLPVRLPARGQVTTRLTVSIPREVRTLSDTNLLQLALTSGPNILADDSRLKPGGSRALAQEPFGLCAAPVCRVRGPFFDDHETWLASSPLPSDRYLETPTERVILPFSGEEWGNYRVDIGKEYLPEAFADPEQAERAFQGAETVNCFEDNYCIGDALGLYGPCCAYFEERLLSPTAREAVLFVGSTDPYKLWLNGVLIGAQSGSKFWFCDNDVIPVTLSRGVNRLIVKIARQGADNRFTLVARHPPRLPGFDSPAFITDLVYLAP